MDRDSRTQLILLLIIRRILSAASASASAVCCMHACHGILRLGSLCQRAIVTFQYYLLATLSHLCSEMYSLRFPHQRMGHDRFCIFRTKWNRMRHSGGLWFNVIVIGFSMSSNNKCIRNEILIICNGFGCLSWSRAL